MGYYPASLYNAGGLGSMADRADWGGETVDDTSSHPESSQTDMGSGAFPSAGWTQAAYMRNLMVQSDDAGTMANLQGTPQVTDASEYDIAADFSGTSGWGSYFFWGGPGAV
jgi:hypothetical protein